MALDLGGTRFRVAAADLAGNILSKVSELTHAEEGRDAVLTRVKSAIRDLAQGYGLDRILAIGMAVPGPVNPWTGEIFSPPNLPGWDRVPMKETGEKAFGVPCFVGNDANLAALGEHRFGAGRGLKNLIYLTVSTGLGSGIIVDGQLLLGTQGLAAEAGHMAIDANGARCNCGNVGCLETFVSGPWIAKRAAQRLAAGAKSAVLDTVGGDLSKLAAEVITGAAKAGDPFAVEAIREAGTYLGIGIVNLLHLFNPQIVIIGGGVTNAGALLLEPAKEIIATRAMEPYRSVKVVLASLGDDVGLYGGIALALSHMGR